MLISEFAQAAGLSVDTVRFYIRRGLLTPEADGKGGRNPYQIFRDEHVATARFIRFAQNLGMSLNEIAAINDERRKGRITSERNVEILTKQLCALEQKAAEANSMATYLRAKIAWLRGGERGPMPALPLRKS